MSGFYNNSYEGYNLIEIKHNYWALQVVGDTVFVGTFREVIFFAVSRLGFKLQELDKALMEMSREHTDVAHFGIFKTFIYSTRSGLDAKVS